MLVEIKTKLSDWFEGMLVRFVCAIGFLPKEGEPRYTWDEEMYGDSRDCDSAEEIEAYNRIFGSGLKDKLEK